MQQEFQRVAIVNRGEAAMRFIHATREFNQEYGANLCTIALFTDPDRHAMFVRTADEAVPLGPAQIIDPRTNHLKSTYVDYDVLERALALARAEAAWVGWGFVAEHAEFADLCREMGIVFIGPDGDVMRRLGDKISSKLLAEQAHIPIAPWSGEAVETLGSARQHAERLGYPLFIKATAGGGGHGIRRVHSHDELESAFESARAEAFKAFGDPTVFMEHLVSGARHVEVQIIADHHGTTWAAGVRDCTIQRRHQKVLEEAPSPALSPLQDQSIREAAIRLSQKAGYHNAGTVEFLYEKESHQFLFMEMNTRLQVEHPVTECTTGVDLVKLQIHVARGGRLEGEPPRTTGHAIEVRLNAEDAFNGFSPAPGRIERFRIPSGPGVRIDTGVEEGDTIPAEFDSMIAKIIAYGQTRNEALSRLQRVLRESIVVIDKGTSNRAFLLELLRRAEVQNADVDIGWLDRLTAKGHHLSQHYVEVALVQAAIESYDRELRVEQAQFYASAIRGRPQVRSEVGRKVELRYRDHSYSMKVYRLGLEHYSIEVDGIRIDAHLDRLGMFEFWLTVFGTRFHVISVEQGGGYRIELNGVSHRVERDDNGVIRAPAPAVVVSVAVKSGDTVSTGDRLAVLEAMKMETQVVAPFPGTIRHVIALPNMQVDSGAPLMQIETTTDRHTGLTEKISFAPPWASVADGKDGQSGSRRNLEQLRQLMLGFDVDPERTTHLLAQWSQLRDAQADSNEDRGLEDEILNIFVDLCSLFRKNPQVNNQMSGEAPSTEANLFSYLRMLDTHGDGVSPDFVKALKRAVAHYGVTTLDRSPDLEQILLWIYRSHQHFEHQVAPIMSLLERRLTQMEATPLTAEESFQWLLERIVSTTRGLAPAVSELAREVRYRCFERPMFEKAQKQVFAEAANHLDHLALNPNAADRPQRVHWLIDCPHQLARVMFGRFASAYPSLRELMLEVMISRYYRSRTLTDLRALSIDGQYYVTAEYLDNGKRVHVFATHAGYECLANALQAMLAVAGKIPTNDEVALNFFTSTSGALAAPDTAQQEIRTVINGVDFPRVIRYIVVTVSAPGPHPDMGSDLQFTYEPSQDGYAEVELIRGVHPMIAERLHLWRLENFKVERLPSVEGVYLLHAVGKQNPKDERLFAVAEVRDLTPVRDQAGVIVELPHLERMFAEAAASIRSYQSRLDPRKRLYWNRIFLFVRPALNLKPSEMNWLVRKLQPLADGLGLEQVVIQAHLPNPRTGELRDTIVRVSAPGDAGLLMTFRPASKLQAMKPLSAYDQKVVKMRQRGMIYPYEIVRMLTPSSDDTHAEFSPGVFVEHDLDSSGRLLPVDRPYGQNSANIIVGVIRNFTAKYPEGMTRVMLLGDPSKDLGALAEPECQRILAAIDMAKSMNVPVEWFPISAGAKISMDSGVENMDWIARVLRALVGFTQAGGEVNLVVIGINVGAQPYWNAEATMLMHTRGILIMTPKAAMVLTGKRALDYSGSVSAEDNQGIGGYERVMGFNGQAQYFARNIAKACQILMRHYDHTYVAPGERFPRRVQTTDPVDRNVQLFPHSEGQPGDFSRVGEIFSDETNPGRKKSFDIRKVMMAVTDQDHAPLERWPGMRSAETAVVWDAHLGGYPVCLIGIESKPVPRFGFVPADGPDQWTAGTLFPLSSKKVARAINAASNNRPAVILANLSGFDGSPESMRQLQLEYGAEIGRAVVNFSGPIIFCVISRYHGGAYVVFSRALNEQLEVVALEGAYASVIGGAPAAAVVFATEVEARARKDVRLQELNHALENAEVSEKGRLQADWDELFKRVHSEKLGELAGEFDRIHSVHRALKVGALSEIVPPRDLRSFLVGAIERGIDREKQIHSGATTENLSLEKNILSAA